MAERLWKSNRLTRENFNLQEVIKPEFLKLFIDEFPNKHVEVIDVSLFISDESIDYKENKEEFFDSSLTVTLTYPKIEDTKNSKVHVRISEDNSKYKITNAIDSFEG